MEHIRREIFAVTQGDMAIIAGVSQAAISRWENPDSNSEPTRQEMRRIRSKAAELGLPWDDAWFFDTPGGEDAGAPEAEVST